MRRRERFTTLAPARRPASVKNVDPIAKNIAVPTAAISPLMPRNSLQHSAFRIQYSGLYSVMKLSGLREELVLESFIVGFQT